MYDVLSSHTDMFKAPSPLTPGTRPVCGPPWVPHAHHEESGHHARLQQLFPQPHLPHCCDPVGVSSHQATVQHRLHRLALCWLRNKEILNHISTVNISFVLRDARPYPYGAGDEGFAFVGLGQRLEERPPLVAVQAEGLAIQAEGLRNPTGEVNQRLCSVPSLQGLIAAVYPREPPDRLTE